MYMRDRFEDHRGYFEVLWDETELFFDCNFKPTSANCAHNRKKFTLRGLHFQQNPFAQAKFVSCIRGSVFDVIVDLRRDSPTYLSWEGFELNSQSGGSIYIAKGCAHGYLTLEDDTSLSYLIEGTYQFDAAGILKWDDARIGINWPGDEQLYIISQRDQNASQMDL